jgi:hypothetical protein
MNDACTPVLALVLDTAIDIPPSSIMGKSRNWFKLFGRRMISILQRAGKQSLWYDLFAPNKQPARLALTSLSSS